MSPCRCQSCGREVPFDQVLELVDELDDDELERVAAIVGGRTADTTGRIFPADEGDY